MHCPMERVASSLILLCALLTPAATWANPFDAIDSLQVRTGALYLHRSDNNDDVIVAGGGSPLLTSAQASPGSDIGWELALISRFRDEFALELRYFQVDSFDYNTRITSSPAGLGFAIDNSVIGYFGGGSPIVGDISYQSQLSNIELNERWRIRPDVDFLLGLRHVQNRETLRGIFADDSASNTMQFDADNYLTGVQAGLDARLWQRNRLRIEGLATLGAFHNVVRSRYDLNLVTGGGSVSEWASDRKNTFSLLGELQLMGVYQITDRIALRGGYQLLFMTGIATAPNQVVDTQSQFISGSTATHAVASDSPIYHGLSAQLEIWLGK